MRISRLCLWVFLVFAGMNWGNAAWIYAKAWLGDGLIRDAWVQTIKKKALGVKPWSWADTWPVARIQVNKKDVDLIVLEGSSGSSLAFGPGHVPNTGYPGESSVSVIAGHRDTHFAFLQHLVVGDRLRMQGADGQWTEYQVQRTQIANTAEGEWQIGQGVGELHLITCYPFGATDPGGPLRFVVVATPIA